MLIKAILQEEVKLLSRLEPTLFVHSFAHSHHSSFSLLPCLQIPHNTMSNKKNLNLFLVGNRNNIDENSYKSLYNCYYDKSDMPKSQLASIATFKLKMLECHIILKEFPTFP